MGRFVDFETKICATWLNAVDDIVVAASPSEEISATAGQSSFPVVYTPGYLAVFLNGVRLAAADYSAADGETVVLSYPAVLGDIVVFAADSLRNTPNPV